MRPNKQKANPCKAITWYNGLILSLVRNGIRFISFLALPDRKKTLVFEENPLTMSWKEVLYFGYKYYVKNNNNFAPKASFLSFKNGPITFLEDTNQKGLTLTIAGDLMPYKLIDSKNCKNLWSEQKELFESDITVANLETPLDTTQNPSFVPELMLNDMNFNSSANQFDILNGKGFDVLSLANNHTLDMGYRGAEKTKQYLTKKGIASCGIGQKNNTHCILNRKGFKIGFISYTYSLNQYELDESESLKINLLPLNKVDGCDISEIQKEAKLAKSLGAEFVVLMIHTGNAYQPMPGPQTQKLFKEIAEKSEVDFIVGGHPHNIQPIELFKRGSKSIVAAYSLGDFIAYDIYQRCHLSLFLTIELVRIGEQVILKKLSVNPNYMQFKNTDLRLRDFNSVLNEEKSDKKIADLHQLYERTILEPNV